MVKILAYMPMMLRLVDILHIEKERNQKIRDGFQFYGHVRVSIKNISGIDGFINLKDSLKFFVF